jgi:hypothetical protein
MTSQRRLPRFHLRLGCFVLAMLLLWPLPFWLNHSRVLVQASPFVSISLILAGGTLGMGSILGFGFSLIALARKRWFCRNICPVGLLLDGVAAIGLRKKRWWARCPSIGRYVALLTIAGSVAGYPLFLWMDPLALFSSAFSVYAATNLLSCLFSMTGLTILLFIAVTSGDLWCARICPLGGTQGLLASLKSTLLRIPGKPKSLRPQETVQVGNTFSETRRAFLAIAAGAGLGFLAGRIGLARSENAPLRPPGAIEEDKFTGQCVRWATVYAPVHRRSFIRIPDKPGSRDCLRPSFAMKRNTALKNVMPVQRSAQVAHSGI